jgi:N6-adenosine-specific RNA methylase IME4
MTARYVPLPTGPFGVIYADPPWRFATWSAKGRGRCPDGQGMDGPKHYETMSMQDIMDLPVGASAAADCVLMLWATDPLLPFALDVGRAWGFTYQTVGFVWAKQTKTGKRWFMGMGHWTRSNPEYCLLFTKGKPKRLSRGVRKLIEAPVREHSRKPDEARAGIEALVAGPYLELFARSERPGWTAWGDQVERFADEGVAA